MASLRKNIRTTREALRATTEEDRDRPDLLALLGFFLRQEYERTGRITILEEAIRVTRKAIKTTSEDHAERAGWLNNLGLYLVYRFKRKGKTADLDEAVDVGRSAVSLSTLDDDAALSGRMRNLASHLHERFLASRANSDLDEAIEILDHALSITSEDDADRPNLLSTMGLQLGDRYARDGDQADLQMAISLTRKAVDATPKNDPDLAGWLCNLGMHLRDRFEATGAISDLEEAIQVGYEAAEATPERDFHQSTILNNLALHLWDRYLRTDALGDLEESIKVTRQAIDTISKGSRERITPLNNLAIQLEDRFRRTQQEEDLAECLQCVTQAISTSTKHKYLPWELLLTHGGALYVSYTYTGDLRQLKHSIAVFRDTIAATPKDSPDRAKGLSNLGIALQERFLKSGSLADLEESIEIARNAIAAASSDHADQAPMYNILGHRLGMRYSKTQVIGDVEEAISCHQTALNISNTSALNRILAAKSIVSFCGQISDWEQAHRASAIAISLIPKLTLRSLVNSDKQHLLGQVTGLACDAAAVALNAEREPVNALNLLEEGRGVLAASVEDLRADILDLQEKHPQLAKQFLTVRDKLEVPHSAAETIHLNNKSTRNDAVRQRYDAGKEFDQLVNTIRGQPGFEGFLLSPSLLEMKQAAAKGPIVVINTSDFRCDAILIEIHQIRLIPLPKLKSSDIRKKARKGELGDLKLLEWLWGCIAHPVLDALGFTKPPTDDEWPHVWWIPTGSLSKFPLHAAGRHMKDSTESTLDRVISSYGTSVKAIIQGRQRPMRGGELMLSHQALIVTMNTTPKRSKLPFVSREADMLKEIYSGMNIPVANPKREKQGVMSDLRDCTLFHFAGHGYTDAADPSKSALLLEDWETSPLMVADLLELNIRRRKPFLAYLSACGTGQVRNEKSLDENLHLIGACQLAGFRHTIGTLWSVNDEICVDVARLTYEGMRDGGMTDESVCLALHKALRVLREKWLSSRTNSENRRDRTQLVRKSLAKKRKKTDRQHYKKRREAYLWNTDSSSCSGDESGGSFLWVPFVHFGV